MTQVCLLALANVARDARTINVARTLAAAGIRTTVVSAGEATSEMFDHIPWADPGGRAWQRWLSYHRFATAQAPQAPVYAAMDFWALPTAARMARRAGARLLYDAREFTFALGPLAGRPIRQRIIERVERHYIGKADVVTVSGPLDADIIATHYSLPTRPDVVLNVPPYADPVATSPLRAACGLDASVPLILYQGVVHHGRGLRPIMEAMGIMPDVHLAVIGEGPAMAELRAASVTMGVEQRVHWLGARSYDELHAWTCGATVGLTLIEPLTESYRYALPNKFYEYMRAHVPQLVTDLPALRVAVGQHPVGMLVPESLTAAQIAEALRQLLVPATYVGFAQQCASFRSVAWERQAATILDIYSALVER
jgi:hypothetical protein